MFDGKEDAKKFLYVYENVVKKGKTEDEKADKLVDFLKADAFNYYFYYFTEDNAPTEEAKSFQLVKKAMLEKFSTKKTDAETMREALNLRYVGENIKEFIFKAGKLYKEANFSEELKFGMIQQAIRSDQALM